jgi:hypothetical protein
MQRQTGGLSLHFSKNLAYAEQNSAPIVIFCCLDRHRYVFVGNMTVTIHKLLCGNLQLNL